MLAFLGFDFDPATQAAFIAAIPATLLAGAAWRATITNRKQLSTSNGDTPGVLLEKTYDKVGDLELRFNEHIMDSWLHRR